MGSTLTRHEILKKIPKLKKGSFDYWVRFRASIQPVDVKPQGRMLVDLYPRDCINKIKAVMGVE